MIQFYLLSVVFNTITGLVLINNKTLSNAVNTSDSKNPFYEAKNFLLILGILTAFTGFMKLLLVMDSNVVILGDLLPAIAGLVGGAIILFDFYKESTSVSFEVHPIIEKITTIGRKYIGIACLIIAFFHFILPQALFF